MSALAVAKERSALDIALSVAPRACADARVWLACLPAGTTPEQAWATCDEAGWLLWFATMTGVSQRAVVAAGCDLIARSIDAEERAGKEEEIADEKAAVEQLLTAVRAWAAGTCSEVPGHVLRSEAPFAHAAEALCEAVQALDRGSLYIAASALSDLESYVRDGARLACSTAAIVRHRLPWRLVAAAVGGVL